MRYSYWNILDNNRARISLTFIINILSDQTNSAAHWKFLKQVLMYTYLTRWEKETQKKEMHATLFAILVASLGVDTLYIFPRWPRHTGRVSVGYTNSGLVEICMLDLSNCKSFIWVPGDVTAAPQTVPKSRTRRARPLFLRRICLFFTVVLITER